jgi:hypothetical protein
MLREAKLTIGIGAKTTHNIQWSSTQKLLKDRDLASAHNARQKKKTKTAKHKLPTVSSSRLRFSSTSTSIGLILRKLSKCVTSRKTRCPEKPISHFAIEGYYEHPIGRLRVYS